MINKDGKLFGKISIVDIAVVLIIIVLGFGIYSRFAGQSNVVTSSSEKIECTFIVKNVRDYTVDALMKKGTLYDKVTKEVIGEITEVKATEGMQRINISDGSYVEAAPEEKYNVYITVEFSGKISDNGFYTGANKYLGAGTSVGVFTKDAECWALVHSINKAE